ncbi:hypothetical protein [Rummeliibacillus stabekisii]|uniref:hypothetical protein n=1 Tax=Rummeliibacillus stabekisii TaxID=241244 RepID=UPI00371E2DE8
MTKSLNKFYNPNPLKKITDDSVVRALAKATNSEWDTVYTALYEIGTGLKVMPDSKESYEQFLKDRGFTYTGISTKKGSKRPTVEKFTKANKKGTYVIRVAHHVVTAVDGFYFDTWDSGHKAMYGYWTKPDEGTQSASDKTGN